MQFQDDLAAGVTLVRPALQSPEYKAGKSGWKVAVDGSAEFNNIVVRGATDGSTDAVIIGPDTGSQIRIGYTGTGSRVQFPMHSPGEGTPATLAAGVVNSGSSAEQLTLAMQGPSEAAATDRLYLGVQSQSADGQLPARVYVDRNGTQRLLSVDGNSGMQVSVPVTVSTTTGQVPLSISAPQTPGASLVKVQAGASTVFELDGTGTITNYSSWQAFTPTWTGVGSAAFSTNQGSCKRIGDIWLWEIYAVASAAGSGTTPVSIGGLPFTPYRAGSRQVATGYAGGVVAGGNGSTSGIFGAVLLASGSGPVIDRVIGPTGLNLNGENIGSQMIITLQGWMRAA